MWAFNCPIPLSPHVFAHLSFCAIQRPYESGFEAYGGGASEKVARAVMVEMGDRGMYCDNNDTWWVGDLEKFPFRLVGRMFSVRSDRMRRSRRSLGRCCRGGWVISQRRG